MKRFSFILAVAGLVFGLVGCTSEQAVKNALKNNPDLIFDVIKDNPSAFLDAATEAQKKAQVEQRAKQEEERKAEREEEFKNPKKPVISDSRAIRGNKDAPILVVEYSDFECPYCRRGYTTIEEVREKYGDKIKFVFKHLPLSFHKMAMPAAKRFEAIAMQSPEKAYKFHDLVFENQSGLGSGGEKFLDDMAKKAGADVAKMKKDMESKKVKEIIEADMAEAQKFGISGTPGFVVGGVTVKGAYPASEFISIIDTLLEKKG